MSNENSWSRTAASVGFLAALGAGIAAAAYTVYKEYENSQAYHQYEQRNSQSNRNRNQTGGSSYGGNSGFSQEKSRQELEVEKKLAELREERQRQLENDGRLLNEEERVQEMELGLECFSDEFDREMDVNTERGNFYEDFDDWKNNQHNQQLKKEFRSKQEAKHLERQNDQEDVSEFNNVVMPVRNTSCEREQNQFTNLNQTVDSAQDSPQEFEDALEISTVKKPKTEEQKAAQRKKKKLRRQRKRAEKSMKSLNLNNQVETDEDK